MKSNHESVTISRICWWSRSQAPRYNSKAVSKFDDTTERGIDETAFQLADIGTANLSREDEHRLAEEKGYPPLLNCRPSKQTADFDVKADFP